MLDGGDVVAAEVEEVADLVVGREEPLRLAGRLEPLHLPFSSSRRLVRVLRPVVEALVPAALDPGHQLTLGRAVARELVGDHHPRGLGIGASAACTAGARPPACPGGPGPAYPAPSRSDPRRARASASPRRS